MKQFWLQCCLLLACAIARAESNPLSAVPMPLDVVPVLVTEPGLAPATHAYITARGANYDILLMSGFRLEGGVSQSLVRFTKIDNSAWLTFRVIPTQAGGVNLDVNTCTNFLADEFPNCRIRETYTAVVAGHGGLAFEFTAPFSGFNSHHRIVYIPTAKGIWEFHLQASEKGFGPANTDFRDFQSNFRECPNGRADLVPPPRDPGAQTGN